MAHAKDNGETIDRMFASLRNIVDCDLKLREEINVLSHELELHEREIIVALDRIHMGDEEEAKNALNKCQEIILYRIKPLYGKLKELVQPNTYYKFHDAFRHATQRTVFAVLFFHYFSFEKLISFDEVASCLGIFCDGKDGFHLDLEDYLYGVLLLVTELSRFIINTVAAGDNKRPFQIAAFVRNINANFRLLNLKNDALRRKFDALKYEVQRCDQVVYDLSIRGLKPAIEPVDPESSKMEFPTDIADVACASKKVKISED